VAVQRDHATEPWAHVAVLVNVPGVFAAPSQAALVT
jgi:hypothetical protein